LAPPEVVPESISVKFDQLTMAHDIQQQQISTNNIARGMVRGSQVRF
jgi:hypothetical protein